MSDKISVPLPAGYTSLPELDRLYKACQVVSTEAFADTLGTVLFNGVAKLSASMKEAFRFMTTWDFSQPEKLQEREFYRILKQMPYSDVSVITVYQPVGFTGYLKEYSEELFQMQLPAMQMLLNSFLKPALKRYSGYLSELDDLTERRIKEWNTHFGQADLNNQIAREAKWSVEGNRTTEVPFGQIFQNNSECYDTAVLVNRINTLRWHDCPPKAVEKTTKDLVEVIGEVLKAVESKTTPISRVVLQALADDVALIARWIEWYSVMNTRIIDLTTAMKLSEKKLVRAL